MTPARFARLDARTALIVIVFGLLLAGATASLLAVQFRSTRQDAVARSRQGIERQVRETLTAVVSREVRIAEERLRVAALTTETAAGYLANHLRSDPRRSGGAAPRLPPLTRGSEGQWFDADPQRRNDIWIGRNVPLDEGLEDLRAVYAFADLLPPLFAQVDDAVALFYLNERAVTLYHPARDLHERLPAEIELPRGSEVNPDRTTVWSRPYLDWAGQGPVVTISTPIYIDDAFRGVIGLDLSLTALADQLATVALTPGGFAFLLDADRRLVAAPAGVRDDLLAAREVADAAEDAYSFEVGAPELRPVADAMQRGERGLVQLALAGVPHLIAYEPLPALGWSFALAAPLEEMTAAVAAVAAGIEGDAARTLRSTLGLLAASLALALVAALAFARRWIVRPVTTLMAGAREVARGNLDVTLPAESPDELGELARAFNRMTHNLRARSVALERASASLRASEERYDLAVRGSNDGLWDWDVRSGSVYYAPRWKRMLGFADEDLDSSFATWEALLHPDDRERALASVDAAIRGETASYELEHRLRTKRGDYRWILARGAVLRDAQGDAYRMAGSHTDITERVRARELLETRVEERTRDLLTLLEVARTLTTTLDLPALVAKVLERLATVIELEAAQVHRLDAERLVPLVRHPAPPEPGPDGAVGAHDDPAVARALMSLRPVGIPDLTGAGADATIHRTLFAPGSGLADALLLPLIVRGRAVGVLSLYGSRPGGFRPERIELAQSFAHQLAVAVENARLYRQAGARAALEERQKLARDLHDSVSQALYGIALGTRTALEQVARDPMQATRPLEYVLTLTETAIAEMRALIFELRPEALEREGLVAALNRQADGLRARHRLIVDTELCREPDVPLAVKEALYRVTSEALANVVKHAGARHVGLELACDGGALRLRIRDDGRGFDPSGPFPGHLGVTSMRERIESLAGRFHLSSAPGAGTRLEVELPAA